MEISSFKFHRITIIIIEIFLIEKMIILVRYKKLKGSKNFDFITVQEITFENGSAFYGICWDIITESCHLTK